MDHKTRARMLSPSTGTENARGLWLAAAAMFFVNGAVYGAWATQIPLATARLGISDAVFGSMLIAMSGGAICTMSLSGRLARAAGMRPPLFASVLVLFLTFLPLCMLDSIAATLVCMFLFGGAAGLLDVVTNAFAADVETRLQKHVMSSIHAMWSFGGLAGAATGSGLLFLVNGPVQALLIVVLLAAIFLAFQSQVTFSELHDNPARTSLRGVGNAAMTIGAWRLFALPSKGRCVTGARSISAMTSVCPWPWRAGVSRPSLWSWPSGVWPEIACAPPSAQDGRSASVR
ncbi:MAG TPA: MFS transporter [Terriglobales bacterium]|nr:MFS transporter [Terriglobales bacterium]